jgi:general secretion pathway protein G
MVPTDRQLASVFRLFIASLVGLTVCCIAIGVVWRSGFPAALRARQIATSAQIVHIDEAVQAFRQATGSLPKSLADLGDIGLDPDDVRFDVWGHPIIYSEDNGSYIVRSLGRDGKPGGQGLDSDLSASTPHPPEAYPTLYQFLFELPTGGMIAACVFCGSLAIVLTLYLVRAARPDARAGRH